MNKEELRAEIKRLAAIASKHYELLNNMKNHPQNAFEVELQRHALTAKIEELKDARKEIASLQQELAAERSRNYPTEIEGMKKTVDYFHARNAKLNRELGGITALHRGEFSRLAAAHRTATSKLHEIIDDLKSQVRALTPEVAEPDDDDDNS